MATHTRIAVTALLVSVLVAGGYSLVKRLDRDLSALSSASLEWPRVSGLVVHSDLTNRRAESGNVDGTGPKVDVSYEYVVDNKVYRNNVVRFDQQLLSSHRKEILVASYPAGKRVDVFYDPDDPGESVLERDSWSPNP